MSIAEIELEAGKTNPFPEGFDPLGLSKDKSEWVGGCSVGRGGARMHGCETGRLEAEEGCGMCVWCSGWCVVGSMGDCGATLRKIVRLGFG